MTANRLIIALCLATALSGCNVVSEKQARDWVADIMRDPDSAKFEAVKTIGEGREMLACGKVNAKNGFGAFAGYRSFMIYNHQIYVASNGIQDIGVRMCCNWLYDAGMKDVKTVDADEFQRMCRDIGDGDFLPIE